MDERKHNGHHEQASFFRDPQKLTFALGLTSGLAIMAIVGFVIVSVKSAGSISTASTKGDSGAIADTSGTVAQPPTQEQFDPLAVAKSIGLNESKFQSCLDSKKYTARVDQDLSEGNTAGVNGTPTSFINGTPISGALPYSEIKKAIDAALAGTKGSANVPAVSKDDHVRGAKNPKVYLIEYSDFQCPFCRAYHPTIKQALQEYKDQVALVYRHFPLESIHPQARALAEGSECANELGGDDKFWEYHDQVFEG